MGSRRAVIGWGWALLLSCGGSDRVTLVSLPDAATGSAVGSGGAGGAAVAEPSASGGLGGSGGSPGRVREGSPSVDGIVGAGGGGLVALDAGAANTPDGGRAGAADGGALGNGGTPDRGGVAGASGASGDDAGAGGAGAAGGVAGAGVAGAGGAGAAGAAGTGGGSSGAAGASGNDVVAVNLGPTSLGLFAPPIDSSRYAVAGYDAAAGVCVSIIWDFSNNGLELGRHCDDFGQYVSFPYVLVGAAPAQACASSWGYVGLQPSAASGCIDPIAGLVNVRLEVESEGVRYVVRAVNDPDLVGP